VAGRITREQQLAPGRKRNDAERHFGRAHERIPVCRSRTRGPNAASGLSSDARGASSITFYRGPELLQASHEMLAYRARVDAEVATDISEGLPSAAELSRLFDLVAVHGGVSTLGPGTVQVV
jgi:hypothetical protein